MRYAPDFIDRAAAGDRLATPVLALDLVDPIVLALPRGGVVDDGIATGGTVKAALKGIALAGPSRLVLAVPVAPMSALDETRSMTDEIICLATPEHFQAVGMHYRDFTQTSDEEVIALLDEARRWRG